MADDFSPPSIDPSSRGDLSGTVRLILTKFLQSVDDMLPARVIAYDRTTNRARVQPLVAIVTTDKKQVQRAQIASLPVFQFGGGGFVLSFPLNSGDLGWIKASDRDISLFLQALNESPPNTQRLHSFEDALFIPETMFKDVVINEEDAENVVFQTVDGTVRIALFDDKVKITAPRIECVAPEILLTASTKVTIDTPLTEITGELTTGTDSGGDATFGGNVRVEGHIVAAGEITTELAGGIELSTHLHSGVQSGGSNTGGPVP